MPRYFFDVFDGDDLLADSFGDEFASDQDAAKQARELLPEFLLDKVSSKEDSDAAVSVRTPDGAVLYRALAILRSAWAGRDNPMFDITVNQSKFYIAHSRSLRAEASSLAERMHVDTYNLFLDIQKAVAIMEVSRKIIGDKGE